MSIFGIPNEDRIPSVSVQPTRDPIEEFGPTLLEHAKRLGITPKELATQMLIRPEPIRISLKHKGAEGIANFIPGHIVQGNYGPNPIVKVMVISKYPGKDEDFSRRLFVGDAGKLLRNSVQDAQNYIDQQHGVDENLNYDRWYLTNVCRFHPPDGSKTVRANWIKECKFLLEEELRINNPDWILALGSEAVKFLFGSSASVTKFRGSVLDYRIRADETKVTKVFVTENPAAACYNPDKIPGFRGDMNRFCSMIRGLEKSPGDVDYYIIRDVDTLWQLVHKLLKENQRTFAIDCEWAGMNWQDPRGHLRSIQFSWKPNSAALLALNNEDGSSFEPSIDAAVKPLQQLWCQRDNSGRPISRVIGHFFRADIPWLAQLGIDVLPFFYYDTILAHHLMSENMDHKLEVVAAQITDLGRYDIELHRWIDTHKEAEVETCGYGNIPDNILYPYALRDADATFRIYETTRAKIDGYTFIDPDTGEMRGTFSNVCMRPSAALLEMEMTGLLADKDRMFEIREKFVEKREELVLKLQKSIDWPDFNPQSYQQKVEFVFGEEFNYKTNEDGLLRKLRPETATSLHKRPIKTTGKPALPWDRAEANMRADPSGNKYSPAVDDEVLGILSLDDKMVSQLRDIGILGQVLKNFLREDVEKKGRRRDILGCIWEDGRVHTILSQLAETGRMRSSWPNLQNLPNKRMADYRRIFKDLEFPSIRSCFIAPPGCVFVEADYSQAELLVLAYLSGDEEFLAVLEDPTRDLHAERAVEAFHLSCAPTKEGLASFGKSHLRIAAKTINFGIPYQRSPLAIVREVKKEGVKITADEASYAVESYFKSYPKVKDFLDTCMNAVKDPGYIENPFGRIRHFITNVEEKQIQSQQREACNYPIQSTVADAVYTALGNFYYYRKDHQHLGYRMVLAVHDSVMLQVPYEDVEEVVERVVPICMTERVKINTVFGIKTLPVDIKVTLRWDEKANPEELKAVGVNPDYAGSED